MNHTSPFLLLLGSFAFALPSSLDAQPPNRGDGGSDHWLELFERADTNHDGSLSKLEFENAVADRPRTRRGEARPSRGDRRRPDARPPRDRRPPGPRGTERGTDRQNHRHHGGPPQPGTILPRPLQDHLQLSDDQREEFDALQAEVTAKMNEILTNDQQEQLRRMPPPPHRGPGHRDGDRQRRDRRPPPRD